MIIVGRRSSLLLLVGDIAIFVVSLYFALWLRHRTIPSIETLAPYIVPFTILAVLWVLVFYGAGLYSKRLALFPSQMPDTLLMAHSTNLLLAVLLFFLVTSFGISPKTILALYFLVSLALLYFWRLVLYPRLSLPRDRERISIAAEGPEADELVCEVNRNPRYGIEVHLVPPGTDVPTTFGLEELYEEVFDRIPLSQLTEAWFREQVSHTDPAFYLFAKRVIDIVGGVGMGLITLILIPAICIANHLEGRGPLFLRQERFGKNGSRMHVYKFRSMQRDDSVSKEWTHEGENRITKVGAFLRKTSLDEFPQFINILRGEISLVGPRNDILGLGQRLQEALPYYNVRYLVLPGITGWAQINQQYEPGNASPQSVEETKVRLAYDFYYLKHRSLGLDLIIALQTIRRMFFRAGS